MAGGGLQQELLLEPALMTVEVEPFLPPFLSAGPEILIKRAGNDGMLVSAVSLPRKNKTKTRKLDG